MTTLYCSFCAKSQHDVQALIKGPTDALCICDECVDLCATICSDQRAMDRTRKQLDEIKRLGT